MHQKLTRWIVVLALLFISACSSASTQSVNFRSALIYNMTTHFFDDMTPNDILYPLRDSVYDFQAVVATTPNAPSEGFDEIIDVLHPIANGRSLTIRSILEFTSSQLNTQASLAGVTLSIDDIVRFNDLKAFAATLPSTISLSKVQYIEARIGRLLTTNEADALHYLQQVFNAITQNGLTPPSLDTFTYEELVSTYQTVSQTTLSESAQATLALAYDVLSLLITFS